MPSFRARPRRLLAPLAGAAATVALAATALTTPVQAAAPGAPAGDDATAPVVGRAVAERALAEVERAFAGDAAPDHSPTLALRDLWRAQGSLSAEDREAAAGYLARPTDPTEPVEDFGYGDNPSNSICGTICVHWVESGPHAVVDDGDLATTPAYVTDTLRELEQISATYVQAGYRPVKSDGTLGGNAKPDVYLTDIGTIGGFYGYCASDAEVPEGGPYDVWAYCVLDDDYSADEFPANTPTESLQVTAAHEYFHAVQFGYDAFEDAWLMEATATWVEDELYPDVDDNLQYLAEGPLGRPYLSLDTFEPQGLNQYGAWIFFRFLTESVVEDVDPATGMPVLVREVMDRLDGSAQAAYGDEYSLQAVENALAAHGWDLGEVFAAFSVANRDPGANYLEGLANDYPTAPTGQFRKVRGWHTIRLDHLSSATRAFRPKRGTRTLVLRVDLPDRNRGSLAAIAVHQRNGGGDVSLARLDRRGDARMVLPFTRSAIAKVEVTLVNASTRYSCWSGTLFSCQGVSRDDDLTARIRAVVRR